MWPWHKACETRALELSPTFCSVLLKGIEGSECVCVWGGVPNSRTLI